MASSTIPDGFAHHLEALEQLDPEAQAGIRALIEGVLRHQARRLGAS